MTRKQLHYIKCLFVTVYTFIKHTAPNERDTKCKILKCKIQNLNLEKNKKNLP